ncbi:MAG: hypothetical protein H6953_15560 [Chromatiaceae bacterium]|nr:hypothetical protein [Chromatiaceae bacterium]MCP5316164.1 hypothetical protein [Chromatiaceae bacterium]
MQTPSNRSSAAASFVTYGLLLILVGATIFVYARGLHGPFLLDDSIHITQNRWVKIDSLSWSNLSRAWDSSFSAFPSNRPLAQVSFGINHALAGLDSWSFKATNLAIHLICGVVVFLLAKLVFRTLYGPDADRRTAHLFALVAAAFWLLHPLHVSTVLYTVQRMTQISTLFELAGLTSYIYGRIRLSEGRPGAAWVIAAAPLAMVGFLAKESAGLFPLLLLAAEFTLLNRLPLSPSRTFVRSIQVLYVALPIVAAVVYFILHPGYFNHDGRPFTLDERLMTQARVLWLYLKWLFVPDISAYGLFHDDIAKSTGLIEPPFTILAIVGLIGLTIGAIVARTRWPVFAFAVLFFLASHSLESSAFPLEMVFEHRNYLASVGPILFLTHLIMVGAQHFRLARAALILGLLLLLTYSFVTYLRTLHWSSIEEFAITAAENHPRSPRANFFAAQVMINAISRNPQLGGTLGDTTRTLLQNGLAADPECINCLFGMMVLDQYLDRVPDSETIERVRFALRNGLVGPTKVSVSQFSFLVKWQRSNGVKLSGDDLESLFEAALANPGWNPTGRAGIEAAYREYYEFVVRDLELALPHAKAATDAWPEQWSYHVKLADILRRLGRTEEALAALEKAQKTASNADQTQQTATAIAELMRDSRN